MKNMEKCLNAVSQDQNGSKYLKRWSGNQVFNSKMHANVLKSGFDTNPLFFILRLESVDTINFGDVFHTISKYKKQPDSSGLLYYFDHFFPGANFS